jgi:hypothetical protein
VGCKLTSNGAVWRTWLSKVPRSFQAGMSIWRWIALRVGNHGIVPKLDRWIREFGLPISAVCSMSLGAGTSVAVIAYTC